MAEPGGKFWKTPNLIWKSWAQEDIVFNLASGNTHLLNPVAVQVLKILEQKCLNAHELARELASSDRVNFDAELVQQVEKLLANLDELGLIEPAF